jgi:hypothetical protein
VRRLALLFIVLFCGFAGADPLPPETLRIRVMPEGKEQEASVLFFEPGQLRRRITIENRTKETRKLRLYPTDCLNTPDGALCGPDYGAPNQATGLWVTLSDERLELQPGETARVSCSVTLPETISPGDHTAFVYVEADDSGQAATDKATPEGQASSFSVKLKLRYGVPVLIRSQGELSADFEYQPLVKSYKGGQVILSQPIVSHGNLALRVRSTMILYALTGEKLLSREFEGYLLPNQNLEWSTPISTSTPLARGDYRVVVESEADAPRLPDRKVSHRLEQQISLP